MKRATLLPILILLLFGQTATAQWTITVGKGGGYDYSTIQEAIDAAVPGETVVVFPGTYVENIFFGGKNIVVRSTRPDDPDTVMATIIDGNQSGPVVTFDGTESNLCLLSGFTIRNGKAIAPFAAGGGIRGENTNARIEYNVITQNRAELGAGIYQCLGTIQYNTIAGNMMLETGMGKGGGLYDCDGNILNNWISGHTDRWEYGAGLFGCDGRIEGNSIRSNTASWLGGGLYNCNGLILNNVIEYNQAELGGGLHSCSGITRNNVIRGNAALEGGGLARCRGTVEDSLIVGNRATDANGDGGGGLSKCDCKLIRNNTVADNSAPRGGGLAECRATSIVNCIIWRNSASVAPQMSDSTSPTYSCIQGWTAGGRGNINNDPLFATGRWGTYYLSQVASGELAQSPCVDTGLGTLQSWGIAFGVTRTDGVPDSGTIDMGYHYGPGAFMPVIDVRPDSFTLAIQAGTQVPTQTLEVRNAGPRILNYQLTPSPWWVRGVQPTSGTSQGEWKPHNIFFDTASLLPGFYLGEVVVTGNAVNSPKTVLIRLTVVPRPVPVIAVSPPSFSLAVQEGQTTDSRVLLVWNANGGILDYTVTPNPPWLVGVFPDRGLSDGNINTHYVSFQTATLAAGVYNGSLVITGNASNSPTTVPIEIIVAQLPPVLVVTPARFDIVTTAGVPVAPQALQIRNIGGTDAAYFVGALPVSMITVQPTSSTVSPGEENTHQVFFDTQNLAPGVYGGVVGIVANTTPPITIVPATVTVTPPGLPNLIVSWQDMVPVAPIELRPGNSVVVSAIVENIGTKEAGPFWLECWGSRTGGLMLDRFLTSSLYVGGGLARGGGHSWVTTTPLLGIPDGPYTVVYAADRPGEVMESCERDNRGTVRAKRVLVIRPPTAVDLAVEGFGMLPNPAKSRQTVVFLGRVVNRGTESSGPFWIEFWGSWQGPYPGLHFFLCDSVFVSNLDASSSVSLLSYPRSLYDVPQGTFTICCFADRDDAINELDETNNYQFVPGQVFNQASRAEPLPQTSSSGADICVVSADFTPAAPRRLAPGDLLTFTVDLANRGDTYAGEFWLEYWGSRDGGVTLCDLVASSDFVPGMLPGATIHRSSLNVVVGIPDGPYTIVVVANRLGTVSETDVSNNRCVVRGKRLLVIRPPTTANLALEQFGVTHVSRTGILLGGLIRNTGQAMSGPFWIETWACPGDADYSWLDRFVCDSIFVPDLGPGDTVPLGYFSLYGTMLPGEYTIVGFVDRPDHVMESDETDNYQLARHVIVPVR